MTQKLAPPYDQACIELDRHFSKTHQILTTRQLKAACGGSGSNETYLEYIVRWKAERINRTGVLSTVLSLHNHVESFTKTTSLLLSTLSEQLRMCPIKIPDEGDESSMREEGASDQEFATSEDDAAHVNGEQGGHTGAEQPPGRIEQLAETAAKVSESRYLDDDARHLSERVDRTVPVDRETPLDQPGPEAPRAKDDSFFRADTGSHSAALPLSMSQSETDEREILHDRGAN